MRENLRSRKKSVRMRTLDLEALGLSLERFEFFAIDLVAFHG